MSRRSSGPSNGRPWMSSPALPIGRNSARRVDRMTDVRALLHRTADLAADFLESVDERPVFPTVGPEELREALGGPLPEEPTDPAQVVEELAANADAGLVAIPSGRYFGFVIGGGLPASVAADWLATAWDQNAGLYVGGPSASVI